ncbi:MAG: hypothetical protein RLZZ618_3226, partial [Pseudomonadota bacterium]
AALCHEVSNLRKEAAIALGETAHADALPLLLAAQADPDPEVRKLARLSIARLDKALAA